MPAQYDKTIPTALMVYQDYQAIENETGDIRAQNVVDNAIVPEMMRWLWRDGPVSTDPKDLVKWGFRKPVEKKD